MKIYKGVRLNPKEKTGSEVKVTVDGKPLVHHVEHSPTGFCWGYGGSGPADLALSILWDFLGTKPLIAMYMDFKFEYVAVWEAEWLLDSEEIGCWINDWHEKQA